MPLPLSRVLPPVAGVSNINTGFGKITDYLGGGNIVNKEGDITAGKRVVETNAQYAKKRSLEALRWSARYAVLDFPDVMLWFLPLKKVQMFELAISQNILKYRSVGGQFLAHQHGGNHAIRIDVEISGPNASTILTILQLLHAYGDFSDILTPGYENSVVNMNKQHVPGTFTKSNNSSDETQHNVNDYSWIQSKWHKVFPIVTKDDIMFDMYIESLIYYRTNAYGDHNTIFTTILCRKFVQSTIVDDMYLVKDKNIEAHKTVLITEAPKFDPNRPKATDIGNKSAWTKSNYAQNEFIERTQRVVATKQVLPRYSEFIDMFAGLLHSRVVSSAFNSTYERLKTQKVRNRGVYGTLMDGMDKITTDIDDVVGLGEARDDIAGYINGEKNRTNSSEDYIRATVLGRSEVVEIALADVTIASSSTSISTEQHQSLVDILGYTVYVMESNNSKVYIDIYKNSSSITNRYYMFKDLWYVFKVSKSDSDVCIVFRCDSKDNTINVWTEVLNSQLVEV